MKNKVLISCLVFLLSMSPVNASINITEKNIDKTNNVLTITGNVEKADMLISVNIPVKDKEAADLKISSNPGDLIFYSDEFVSEENGAFTIPVKFSDATLEGKYSVYIGCSDGSKENFPVFFVTKDTYDTEIGILQGYVNSDSYDSFKTEISNNGWKVGLLSNDAVTNKDTALRLIYNYAKTTGLNENEYINKGIFASGDAVQLFKENKFTEAEKLLNDMFFTDGSLIESYKKYINTDAAKTFFAQKLIVSDSISTLEASFRNSIILSVVKNADGIADIKALFEKYGTSIGIKAGAGASAYSAICGKEYTDITDMTAAFNSKAVYTPSGSGSSGNSGSSIGMATITSEQSTTVPKVLDIKFEDLNSVPWAYTAISILYDKKIVSGESETAFNPNAYITREAFVKMLVSLAGYESNANEQIFADVPMDKWYASYVNSAYNNGICSGISDTKFGVGIEISREDMCVMTYNFLEKMNVNLINGEIVFADVADFADYSKHAVGALSSMGIVNGVGNNHFEPKGKATRAQAAVIVNNLLALIEK